VLVPKPVEGGRIGAARSEGGSRIGNKPAISASLFAPGYTMASVLANEFTEATGQDYIAVLIGVGSLLFILSIVVNIVARLLVWSVAGRMRGARA